MLSTEAVEEFHILSMCSWTSDTSTRPRYLAVTLVSLRLLLEEFHIPAALCGKSGHYFYKPPAFSRCDSFVQCLAQQWIHDLRQSGSLWRWSTFFYGVVNLDPVADTRPTLKRVFRQNTLNGEVCTVDASVAPFQRAGDFES